MEFPELSDSVCPHKQIKQWDFQDICAKQGEWAAGYLSSPFLNCLTPFDRSCYYEMHTTSND